MRCQRRHPTLLLVGLLATALAANARALPVRVRGAATLRGQARMVERGELLELRGRLQDDSLVPIGEAWVALSSRGALPDDDLIACGTRAPHIKRRVDGLAVQSDVGGSFCLRWRGAPRSGSIHLAYAGDAYHAAASLDVDFDRQAPPRLGTTLRFLPRPTVLDLDARQLTASAALDLDLATAEASRAGRAVILTDERQVELGRGTTGGDGKVRLQLDPRRLDKPGSGTLRIDFAGSEQLAPAHDTQPVVRRAAVRLELATPPASAAAGGQVALDVRVRSARGPVPSGVVEARGTAAGAISAPVTAGRAQLAVPIAAATAPGQQTIVLRYLSAAPWYHARTPLRVAVVVAPPSLLGRVALTLLVLIAGAWVAVGWRRSRRPPARRHATAPLRAGVQLITRGGAKPGWRGRTVDAHDGQPLSGVALLLRIPSLQNDGVVYRTTSDADGQFTIDLAAPPPAAELIARSRHHSELRRPLPRPGELRIALITRRRAVLDRFVAWTRRRGRPFAAAVEPTPADARAMAGGDVRVARWATRVEHTAFGPAEVDATTEQQLGEEEP